MKVLITGAAGFVGRALCPELASRGHTIRCAVRRQPEISVAGADQILAIGEVDADTDWTQAVEGVDAVVHLAARAHVMRESAADPLAAYRAPNVQGTLGLVRAALASRVRHFVFLSSAKVHGERSTRPFCESDAPSPQDAYALSKLESEQLIQRELAGSGMCWTILRPPLVYGPGVRANFRRLMDALVRGMPLPLGQVDNRRSLIYLGNLVDAIALCLQHPAAANRTFLVSDGEDLSTVELVRRMARALGVQPRLLPVPVRLLRLAGSVLGKRDVVARLVDSLQIDGSLLRRALGWTPPSTVDRGLAETVEWYRSERRATRTTAIK